jgi:hypothetical protein
MSKVEERSKEIIQAALDYANNLDDVKPTDDFSRNLCIVLGQAFMKGAEWADEHQAEKDLELTWEDIRIILDAENDMLRECNSQKELVIETYPKGEDYYGEILKRFKERKGE